MEWGERKDHSGDDKARWSDKGLEGGAIQDKESNKTRQRVTSASLVSVAPILLPINNPTGAKCLCCCVAHRPSSLLIHFNMDPPIPVLDEEAELADLFQDVLRIAGLLEKGKFFVVL